MNSGNSECRRLILLRLEEAGPKGLTATQLRLPSSSSKKGKICRHVLEKLLKRGEIGNLGSRSRPIYVVARYYRPLELAYEQIETIARESGIKLCSRSTYAKRLKGAVKLKADEALKLLVREGSLVKLTWAGKPVYVHVSSLPSSRSKPESGELPTYADINRAYKETVREFGYSDVLIHEIFLRLGGDLDSLKAAMTEACKESRAIASVGDWSLSSEKERNAAIYINGTPHLRIRLME